MGSHGELPRGALQRVNQDIGVEGFVMFDPRGHKRQVQVARIVISTRTGHTHTGRRTRSIELGELEWQR